MTKLIVDPDALKLEFPRASESRSVRVRLLVQVIEYDDANANLVVRKLPNFPSTSISLDDFSLEQESRYVINVFGLLSNIHTEITDPGCIISLVGYYNGDKIHPIECYPISPNILNSKRHVDHLVEMTKMKPID